jgi:hypothetical protein
MKRKRIQIKLLMLFAILLIGIAAHSTGQAQATGSAATSPTTALASIDVCEQRLSKALDAYEKANNALNVALSEIEARKTLENLQKEYIAVKDQMIAAQSQLIKFYQDQRVKGKWQKFFEKIEKILILAAGVYIGKGL